MDELDGLFARADQIYEKIDELLNVEDWNAAIAQYDEVIVLLPWNAMHFYNRALLHQKMGDFESAVLDYIESINRNPKYADSFNNRGLAYAKLSQYDKALEDYAEAIRLAPNDPKAFHKGVLDCY
jgi:tetratricopeptide (TPR) repeat protein